MACAQTFNRIAVTVSLPPAFSTRGPVGLPELLEHRHVGAIVLRHVRRLPGRRQMLRRFPADVRHRLDLDLTVLREVRQRPRAERADRPAATEDAANVILHVFLPDAPAGTGPADLADCRRRVRGRTCRPTARLARGFESPGRRARGRPAASVTPGAAAGWRTGRVDVDDFMAAPARAASPARPQRRLRGARVGLPASGAARAAGGFAGGPAAASSRTSTTWPTFTFSPALTLLP